VHRALQEQAKPGCRGEGWRLDDPRCASRVDPRRQIRRSVTIDGTATYHSLGRTGRGSRDWLSFLQLDEMGPHRAPGSTSEAPDGGGRPHEQQCRAAL